MRKHTELLPQWQAPAFALDESFQPLAQCQSVLATGHDHTQQNGFLSARTDQRGGRLFEAASNGGDLAQTQHLVTCPYGQPGQCIGVTQVGIHAQVQAWSAGLQSTGGYQAVGVIDGVENVLWRQAQVNQPGVVEFDKNPLSAFAQQQRLVHARHAL